MSDLDKKLEGIVGKFVVASHEDMVGEIKQAFIDDGWIEPHKPDAYLAKGGLTMKVLEQHVDAINKEMALDWNKRHGYMTGQEWFDRFEKELPDNNTDCAVDYVDGNDACNPVDHATRNGRFFMRMAALEAAKKAAGLKP